MHTLAAILTPIIFLAAYVGIAYWKRDRSPKPGKDYDERGPF